MSDEFTTLDGEITMSIEEASGVGSVANNLTTTEEGYALDARQGKVLDDKKLDKDSVMNNLVTLSSGYALDARQGKWLQENKVGYADIANDLETDDLSKVLGASQGVVLVSMIEDVEGKTEALQSGQETIEADLAVVTNAMTITDTAIDVKGKYIDNALFR